MLFSCCVEMKLCAVGKEFADDIMRQMMDLEIRIMLHPKCIIIIIIIYGIVYEVIISRQRKYNVYGLAVARVSSFVSCQVFSQPRKSQSSSSSNTRKDNESMNE